MAGEPNPEPFREVCTTINPSDREVAPAVAHARPVALPSATQQNPSSAASASGSTDQQKCAPKKLPATAAPLPKLSSSVFGTESPQEVRELNDDLPDRVRNRSPEAQGKGTPAEGQETKSRGSKDRH